MNFGQRRRRPRRNRRFHIDVNYSLTIAPLSIRPIQWHHKYIMAAAPVARLSTDEYLAHEREADYRSEYYEGFLIAMAGGSLAHFLVSSNLIREISSALKGKPCIAGGSDLRVQVESSSAYFYPDVTVICGEPNFVDSRRDVVKNPTIVIEVLSPSTETRDRGIKSAAYRKLDSLQEYILIDQSAAHIEHYVRTPENAWLLTDIDGLDAQLRIAAIDCTIPLSEIYDKVEFPAA